MGVCAFGLAAWSSTASADYVTMLWDASADQVGQVEYNMGTESDQTGTDPDGLFFFTGGTQSQEWEMNWDIRTTESGVAGGPAGAGNSLVTADLAITNLTGQRQFFFALVTVNLDAPILGSTITNGSVSASVLDLFGSGSADISTIQSGQFANDPIYAGYIDGTASGPARTMWNDPYLLQTNEIGGTATDFDTFAGEAGPEANTSISVWLKVELSPFDQANLIGTFEVGPVPAPGALSLLAMAGVASFGRRRRRI
ncbi:MAG: hypothetical protein ACYTGG_00330 [Planctomycetota bacterium]|jgi:hypothetical protein